LEINSDVTASKQAEQAAREKENLAAIGMAAAMFAHEVSNPLAGLSSSLQMLERTVKNKPGADPLFLLQQATRELHRLEVLLQEFRDLARPQLLKREPTDLSQVINEVLAFQRPLCEAAGISVELQLEPVCNLLVDSGKIRQAVLNIFKNAVEAMPHGGCLTVKAYSSDEEICLEISDTGPGIPESANVFDLFVTTKRDGTGLGLPIVRQIISAHDGTISYVSEPGQGTTFKVALPMTSETEPRHGSDALK
jgi:signal transduction histidine kinase